MRKRKEVIEHARSYVDTPFHAKGRVRGLGIDCVGLILCVAEDLNLKDIIGAPLLRTDYTQYSDQPVGRFVQDRCRERLQLKSTSEMKPGDVVTMRIPIEPCHVGIISEHNGTLYLIHAYSGTKKCVEHILDAAWRRRIVCVFQFPELME